MMNVLTIIPLVILLLLVLLFIIALSAKNEFMIQREITINRPPMEVFEYLRMLKNQDHYNKWVMTDPSMKKEFRGTDGNPGFVYCWDSTNKRVGKGEQEIKKITGSERINHEIRFERPFKGVSYAYFIIQPGPANQTKLIWVFGSPLNFMMKVMHVLLNLKMALGKDLQTSLVNLKTVIEKNK
jgi:uncharacterized protein YndB with AHSA1/START domain